MTVATFDFPQHSFRYEWQRDFRIVNRKHVTLAERIIHAPKHSRTEEVDTRVARTIATGIRNIARAADWIDKRIIGAYRSSSFARRRSEHGDSFVYFD